MSNNSWYSSAFIGKYERKQTKETRENETNEQDNDIGGLFRIVSHEQQKHKLEKDSMDLTESSLFMPWKANTKDWLDLNVRLLVLHANGGISHVTNAAICMYHCFLFPEQSADSKLLRHRQMERLRRRF